MQSARHDRSASREGWLSRRHLLLATVWSGAATAWTAWRGQATGATPTVEWNQVVAAANKEGKVAVNTFTGQGYARVFKLFARMYPGIKLNHTNLEPVEFSPRIIQERKAGVFTWDVAIMPTSTALQVLRPAGVWDPVRPAIIAPAARLDANWRDGFAAGFLDRDKRLAYAFTLVRAVGVFVNVDHVKDNELQSFRDLLAPKWKGRIAISDPRTIGSSFWPLTAARLKLGDEIMKQLLIDQQPVLSRDRNQLTEFMVRGRFPIGIGMNALALRDFQAYGVGKNIKTVLLAELDYQSSGGAIWLVNHSPHPNAARVFINWLLTKDAQEAWARELQTNSRFVGVEPGDPHTLVPSGLRLMQIDSEEMLPELIKTQDLAKQLIR